MNDIPLGLLYAVLGVLLLLSAFFSVLLREEKRERQQ